MITQIIRFLLVTYICVFIVHTAASNHVKPDIHVVLGSSNESILKERVDAAINYINTTNKPNIMFISGGVKTSFINNDDTTEASKAVHMMGKGLLKPVKIVLDEHATNTAENFAYLQQWVNQNYSQDNLPDIVITTSDFHKNRAEQIFHGIIPNILPTWNLSQSDCNHCWTDELIHMKNVEADIHKAKHIRHI